MLEKIQTPKEVKKLTLPELNELAKDVRKRIIEVTAKNGGHVAPSLGATDLAIAILKIFNPLYDRIVWDVGHQSYAYKILTERNERFDTLRQLNGLSGFNNIFESKYDAFGVGHSSTSISAALGITTAKDLKNKKGRTVAVIGDGALTGGISFEAMNHLGHLQKNIIVPCTNCNYCIPCPQEIAISQNFNLLNEIAWSEKNRARIKQFYDYLAKNSEELKEKPNTGNASLCIECGICLEKCPQKNNIPQELKKVDQVFEKGKRISDL